MDGRPLGGEPAAIRSADDVGIEERIVRDDEHAVLRHGDIGLERGHADRDRAIEGRQRVLGHEAARPAMTFEVECLRGRGTEREQDSGHEHSEAG